MRKMRIVVETILLAGITLLFFGIGGDHWGWMSHIQFMPSLMRVLASATALNVSILAALLLLTILFGRIYCSTLCPLGAFQDILIHIRRKAGKIFHKRWYFKFKKGKRPLRIAVVAITAVSIAIGFQPLVALLAPYSAYGRIVTAVMGRASVSVIIVAAITLAVLICLCLMAGREWCNSICPVGGVLGLLSRYAIFKPVINTERCHNCHVCEHECKASCIDVDTHSIDYSRCVDCFDCIGNCKSGAIEYTGIRTGKEKDKADKGRRNFLATTATILAATATEGLAMAEPREKRNPDRAHRLVPPGAQGEANFYERCTACQLCVQSCPNNVLRTSKDLKHLLQPEMGFENGWCRPECNTCSVVCPSGAIQPVEKGEKLSIHIGVASVNREVCVIKTDGVRCGNCARHCPVGAIRMVKPEDGGRPIPVVDENLCIGCGACEHLCPASPVSAITVNGIIKHRHDGQA